MGGIRRRADETRFKNNLRLTRKGRGREGLKDLEDCADIRMSGLMIFRTVLSVVSLAFLLMGDATSAAPFGGRTNRLTLADAYNTPISFYGKVVDYSTNVVAGANVRFRVATDPNDEGAAHNTTTGTEYHTMSDSNGLFSLTGVFGGTLTVLVSKDGFHSTDRSGRMFHYFDHDGILGSRPTQMEPAIFVLKRKRGAEPMIHRLSRVFYIARDGTPVGVSFHARSPSGEIPDLHVHMWSDAGSTNAQGQYDWSYKFSIPGGGLADRKDKYDFQAPSDGYREVIEGAMVAGGDNWHTTIQRDFFGKLQNGCHVRFKVSLTTWGRGSFAIESFFMNPAPGSRNLEVDPKMVERQ